MPASCSNTKNMHCKISIADLPNFHDRDYRPNRHADAFMKYCEHSDSHSETPNDYSGSLPIWPSHSVRSIGSQELKRKEWRQRGTETNKCAWNYFSAGCIAGWWNNDTKIAYLFLALCFPGTHIHAPNYRLYNSAHMHTSVVALCTKNRNENRIQRISLALRRTKIHVNFSKNLKFKIHRIEACIVVICDTYILESALTQAEFDI